MQADYLPLFRRYSQRAMIDALLLQSSVTSQELGRATGLPVHDIASLAAELERGGWLQPAEQENAGVDPITRVYTLTPDAAYSFGVDLGGTKISAAVADFTGQIMAELTEPTDPRGEQHIIDQITALATKLARSAGLDAAKIQSVTVGIPGAINPRTGRISLVPNIKGLADFDVLQCLKDHFGPVVALENDVNLAMLGEAAGGHAKGVRNSAFLALGTGVGLGLIIDGKLVRGAAGAAGEIAYLPIGRNPSSPAALSTGAFELEVGSLAIVRRYQLQGRASITTAQEVFSLLYEGDDIAEAVLDDTARSIALAITALQSILDLEVIVLGGSIGSRPELAERVQGGMNAVFARPVRIVASELGTRAGLVGAVRGAVSHLHDHHFGKPAFADDHGLRAAALSAARSIAAGYESSVSQSPLWR
jgi:predicted NBD/HSP70 family sugar kinase